jgi:LPS sulfotransferase NodH
MSGKFTSFVILGAMRTGSNFLESSLSELAGVTTYGEVFNPLFIGREKCHELFDITLPMREVDPTRLLQRIRENTAGLPGFRYFHDHDPRILEAVLRDPGCAKIVLTRNPLDSFVSFRIALKTNEWMATDAAKAKTAKIRFEPKQFSEFLHDIDTFYGQIRRALKVAGQAAYEIGYDDLADAEVLNGLAAWLGLEARLSAPSRKLKRQNPPMLSDKVTNPEDIPAALARIDLLSLDRPRPAESERNAAIQSYFAAPEAPLLYLPVKAGPVHQVKQWLAALDGGQPPDLLRDFGHKSLRDWRAAHPGHRSFTVVSHPLDRAHMAFSTHLLMPGPECFGKIRMLLRKYYYFEFPEAAPGPDYGAEEHRRLFLTFLRFLKRNLASQTSIRVDPSWATQEAVLRGFAKRQLPDLVIREDQLAKGLEQIAGQIGRAAPPLPPGKAARAPYALADIHDEEVEAAARDVYRGDYEAFGFGDWRP